MSPPTCRTYLAISTTTGKCGDSASDRSVKNMFVWRNCKYSVQVFNSGPGKGNLPSNKYCSKNDYSCYVVGFTHSLTHSRQLPHTHSNLRDGSPTVSDTLGNPPTHIQTYAVQCAENTPVKIQPPVVGESAFPCMLSMQAAAPPTMCTRT